MNGINSDSLLQYNDIYGSVAYFVIRFSCSGLVQTRSLFWSDASCLRNDFLPFFAIYYPVVLEFIIIKHKPLLFAREDLSSSDGKRQDAAFNCCSWTVTLLQWEIGHCCNAAMLFTLHRFEQYQGLLA